jgi:PKD repeat protein
MSKPLTAILAVALFLSASGTVGQLYFVSSQGQTPTEPADLILSESEASPGLAVEIEGTDFGADSSVSIYFMTAEPVDLTEGGAFILQGINANQSATIEPGGASTFFNTDSTALHTLGNLLQSTINQGGNNTTTNATAGISGQNLLVVLEEGTPLNGTMSLDCEDVNIAQGRINGAIGTFGASPGIYEECSISIIYDDTTNAGEIDELIISSDSEEDFANSLVTSATADEEGTFESLVTVPNVEGGEYAILAVANDGRMAISALSVIVAEPADEPVVNATITANATEGGIILNETLTPAPEEEEVELAEEESSEPLTAQITSNETEGTAPATFEFEANVTGGTEPHTYSWDFGDGTEVSNEQTVLHTFEEAGTYNVTLVTTDVDNQNSSDSMEINIEAAALIPTTLTEPLTAEIISNATEGTAPATFEFEANVTGGREPYAVNWDFDDDSGEVSNEQTVLHTFEEAGTYSVTLVATDTDNQDASDSIEIIVEEPVEEEEEEATTTTVQNQTQNNQTDTAGEEQPIVQLDETSVEPGSPLAISGEGFQPNMPAQIFINNVQITNVITNDEGSFNTVVEVPTTVAAGSYQVVVSTEQTTIIQNFNIISSDDVSTEGPSTLRLTAISATDNGEALRNAPVTIFDASSGEVIERGRTPLDIELQEGTYSIFYSDFGRFEFESAEPGRWINTADGGSGLITIREGRNTTITALYSERPAPPPPPPRVTDNSITLRAQDTQGNLIQDMFATIYDAEAAEKLEQGFTELRVDDLPPGTYPIFYANFEDLVFLNASPGTWIQTPFGGVGFITIPDDGEDHNIVVAAQYNRTTVVEEQFNIQAPLDVGGNIFTITSNQTRPEGPFVMSGTFALRVSDEEPVSATLSAYFMSAREDSNENVDLESQRSRDHDTFQIVDLKPRVARPIGPNSYVISGTADLLLNGDLYSNDERVHIILKGGEELTPTNIEIDFRGDERYSAANRLDRLHGVISSGFQ